MKKIFIKIYKIQFFLNQVTNILKIPKKDSDLLIKSIVGSSIRGVDSHGIRLFPHYVKCIEGGRIKKNPKMKFTQKMPSIGILNADNGFGHVAAYKASYKAVKIAKKNGVGIVGVINSSHYGAAGSYALQIAENNLIGFSFTHSDSFAIPFNGSKDFHGTNPYSFSAPIKNKKPLLVDFSSTSIPWNKVIRAKNNKNKLPKGVALNKFGNETINPNLAKFLMPLGGKSFGHKGYALSSSIEILCGPFLGMLHGYRLIPMIGNDYKTHRKLGHFIMAININSIVSKKEYFKNIDKYINDLKKQKSSKNKIFYPGEKEWIEEKIRRKNGIPFDKELINSFLTIDQKYSLNLFKKLL